MQQVIVSKTLLLRPYRPSNFNKTTLAQVVGCLKLNYQGKAKNLDEMDEAIAQGVLTKSSLKSL